MDFKDESLIYLPQDRYEPPCPAVLMRGSYISSGRFFLTHLPVFEIRATIHNRWINTPKPKPSPPSLTRAPSPAPAATHADPRRRTRTAPPALSCPTRRPSPTPPPRAAPPLLLHGGTHRRCSTRERTAAHRRCSTAAPRGSPPPMLRRCSARVRDTLAGRRRPMHAAAPPRGRAPPPPRAELAGEEGCSPEKKHLQNFDLVLSIFCTFNFNIRLYSFQYFDSKMLNLFKKNVVLTLLKC